MKCLTFQLEIYENKKGISLYSFCRTSENPVRRPLPGDGGFSLSVIGIEFVGSRHLVFN